MSEKQNIIDIFIKNVLGKSPDTKNSTINHDGARGHWLESAMNIKHNGKNAPDIFGYEMKNDTTSKTSFGDWSASYYAYQNKKINLTRTKFIEIFGKPNESKGNRHSWSGEPIPSIKKSSKYNGSWIEINEESSAEFIYQIVYSFEKDPRTNKFCIVPHNLRNGKIILAGWKRDKLEKHLNQKFSQNGWFKVSRDKNGLYSGIHFGEPMNFKNWFNMVKTGVVFLDSGMYVGNSRNYSQWRANNNYWESLIVDSYPTRK